ncbi:MAG: hypothetical protein KAW12_13810 [Candidatus Aminicenantes bacterium]|nr:hypothetical protein [Candidatus Aminicenantes bacterium]
MPAYQEGRMATINVYNEDFQDFPGLGRRLAEGIAEGRFEITYRGPRWITVSCSEFPWEPQNRNMLRHLFDDPYTHKVEMGCGTILIDVESQTWNWKPDISVAPKGIKAIYCRRSAA